MPLDEVRLNFNPASLQALNAVLAFLMFGVALDTRMEDFRRVARMPLAMAVAIAAQFLALPAITFALTLAINPAPSIALGMILVACCPPGNISNIITHRAGGNVALSVSMTAVSNALAIALMPLNVAFWGSLHPTAAPLLRSIALDPLEVGLHIVIIIALPFVAGMAVARVLPALTERIKKPARVLSFLCLVGFIVAAIAGNWQHFVNYLGLVLGAVVLHDLLAYALGYGCAAVAGLAEYERRAMSVEVGIRNAGLGLVLIFSFFGGLGGMAVVAGAWGFLDIILGMALAAWWARRPAAGAPARGETARGEAA
ncbi:MAG: bile acid:sodium symporter family protein [Comamonadaceae bacterium]|nr:bile acid:sodium symporter family protein [Comamonadaceae bacterium]